METIDFGCQVRCLNRQRLIPGSSHPQLNQCASQFLAKVRKEVSASDSSTATTKLPEIGWMKLKLSERGLRILPPVSSSSSVSSSSCASSTTSSSSACASFNGMRNQQNRKSDEGFESDSDTSIQPHNTSGACSSGVNSSSSDMEESDEGRGSKIKKNPVDAGDSSDSDSADGATVLFPIRCPLSDILSCQHPAALGRHVVLLTLRSADDSALDILALECSAEEPARILTLLCQKIQASAATHPSAARPVAPLSSCAVDASASNETAKTAGKNSQASAGSDDPAPKAAAVSIQSWSDRDKRTLDAILVDSKHSTPCGAGAKTQNIIRKLERQHSEWSLIQRRTRDGLTHLQVSKQQKLTSALFNHTAVAGGGDVGTAAIRGHFNGSMQTATSGPMLNTNNNKSSSTSSTSSTSGTSGSNKKGMPCSDQMARLETALAITNSNQGQGSRSSGVDGVAAGLKRSDTTTVMHQKLSKSKSSGSSVSTSSTPSSCILSLQTPELPLCPSVTGLSPAVVTDASTSPPPPLPQSLPPTKTSRWSFGAPFRQPQRLVSPEASRRNAKSNQRGRSSERKSSKFDACCSSSTPQTNKSELDGLFVSSSGVLNITSNNKKHSKSSKSLPEILPAQSPLVVPKLKRDPSKTRSFLMKLTSSSRKSPSPPTLPSPPPPAPLSTLSLNSERSGGGNEHRGQHPLKLQSRGRSLIRLRSSTRLQSPAPPSSSHSGQTFLIPTKSGQELTRNIYPKEGPAASQQQHQPLHHQPVFHLLTGHNNKNASGVGVGRLRYNNGPPVTAVSNGWAGYCWNDAAAASLVHHSIPAYPQSIDPNNNQHLQQQQQQQQQQQWIYFQPHRHHHAMPAPPQLQPPTLMNVGDFNKLRLQRSRSQSPGRMRSSQRWLPAAAPAGPPSVGHYYAVPSPIHHQQQPVSLPPDMSHVLSQQHRAAPPCNVSSHSSSNQPEWSSSAARSFRRSKSTHTRMSTRNHLTPTSPSKSTSHTNNNHNNNNKAVTFHAFATVQLVD